VLDGYNANVINAQIAEVGKRFVFPEGITFMQTGEQEDQKETSDFLGLAMMISVMLILFILVTMFNSIGKTLIILSQVVLSIIGVLLGFAFTQMEFSVVMTGVGVIALAGIVVNNGILLIEFTDMRLKEGARPRQAIVEGGKTRLRPVLLTALSTVLGLVPLAIGLNIDFPGLFSNLEPNFYLGGDNVVFWGPLSWTIIFGLGFATVLTLLFIPAFYFAYYAFKIGWKRKLHRLRLRLS
jgi:multidrug efflux pump subunit AcrB